jgi:hypothetical protein
VNTVTDDTSTTRRGVLRTGTAVGAASVGLTLPSIATANPGRGDERGNGTSFGRVYTSGDLWRTNVVKVLDDEPDPSDDIYFLHDGSQPVVARGDVSGAQQSPFVSESAPGDRGWTGGKWVHYGAEVTDVAAFNRDAPLDSEADVLDADYVDVQKGRPGFGPPEFFICPLNGRA